jgi:hypothetical protein
MEKTWEESGGIQITVRVIWVMYHFALLQELEFKWYTLNSAVLFYLLQSLADRSLHVIDPHLYRPPPSPPPGSDQWKCGYVTSTIQPLSHSLIVNATVTQCTFIKCSPWTRLLGRRPDGGARREPHLPAPPQKLFLFIEPIAKYGRFWLWHMKAQYYFDWRFLIFQCYIRETEIIQCIA